MSDQYRGEGLGFYYARLQAQREQRQKALEQHRSIDSSTQIGALNQQDTIDHEVQTEVVEITPTNPEEVAGSSQNEVLNTSDQGVLNETLSPTEEDRIRNVFFGSLAWTHFQHQEARESNRFRPLPKHIVRRRLILPGGSGAGIPPHPVVVPPIGVPLPTPPVIPQVPPVLIPPPIQNPLVGNPPMANLANPKVKFAQFKGKKNEDDDPQSPDRPNTAVSPIWICFAQPASDPNKERQARQNLIRLPRRH